MKTLKLKIEKLIQLEIEKKEKQLEKFKLNDENKKEFQEIEFELWDLIELKDRI
jgi:hypothetical protein